jgi:hypothetical protein
MNSDPNLEKKDYFEININPPSSPLVPLQIHNFVKEINVPVEMKIQTNDRENIDTMTGGNETITKDNGFFGYFKSFFQGFSQQSLQKKKHETQNKSYMNSLFYSGNEEKPKESNLNVQDTPLEKEEPNVQDTPLEKEEPNVEDTPPEEEEKDIVITKIMLTTEDPEMVLRESLKGTKLYYFSERKDLPSQWV